MAREMMLLAREVQQKRVSPALQEKDVSDKSGQKKLSGKKGCLPPCKKKV